MYNKPGGMATISWIFGNWVLLTPLQFECTQHFETILVEYLGYYVKEYIFVAIVSLLCILTPFPQAPPWNDCEPP